MTSDPLAALAVSVPKSAGRLDDLLNSLKSGSFKIDESPSSTNPHLESKEPSRKMLNHSKGSSLDSSKALDFFGSFAFSSAFESSLAAELEEFCL